MSIATYSLTPTTAPTAVNLTTAGNQFSTDSLTLLNGNAVSVYGDLNNVYIRSISPSGAPTGAEVKVNVTAGVDTSALNFAAASRLSNGNIVVSWANLADTKIFSRIFDPTLTPVSGELLMATFAAPVRSPAAAALTGGGYVIAYEIDVSATDHRIFARRFDNSGNQVGGIITVNSSATINDHPSVAGLNDGGFAIIHHQTDAMAHTVMWRSVFSADGSVRAADALFDNTGTQNAIGDVVALSGGGFTAVYQDNQWASPKLDITGTAFNSNGFTAPGSLGRDASIAGDNVFAQAALHEFRELRFDQSQGDGHGSQQVCADVKYALAPMRVIRMMGIIHCALRSF